MENISSRALPTRGVCSKVGRKKTWLWDRVRNDPTFPKPRYMGSRPFWLEDELNVWLATRPLHREEVTRA